MAPVSNLTILTGLQVVLGAGSGGLVGFMLGLVGGGGSILAVPLMIYVVGVHDPHVAIGTSALAVAANAAVGLIHHARQRNVIWRCGGMYALAGIIGAFAGSTLGKHVDGARLLFLFALVMIVVGIVMLLGRHDAGVAGAVCDRGGGNLACCRHCLWSHDIAQLRALGHG
jgi:uncharacterized membrane protein YfcA